MVTSSDLYSFAMVISSVITAVLMAVTVVIAIYNIKK